MMDCSMSPRDAAEWFLAIYSAEEPATETVQTWLRWLDSSAENRQAFEEIVQIWHSTPSAVIARPSAPPTEEEYDGSIPIAEWRARGQRGTSRSSLNSASVGMSGGRQFQNRRRPLLAIAAGAALATGAAVIYRTVVQAPVTMGEFVTRTGEHRELELADGSRVTLGAHSKLAIDLKPTSRQIRLDAGEAYFTVAKDVSRPFVVKALDGEITAIGTAFNVRAVQGRVTVTVTEGSVKVSDTLAPAQVLASSAQSRLSKGEQLSYQPDEQTSILAAAKIKRVDVNESARWREGWLVYRDEPLKYVIADIARYTDLDVEVTPEAADLQFSGAVFKDDIGEWIVALPEVAAVSVEHAGAGYIIRSGTLAAEKRAVAQPSPGK